MLLLLPTRVSAATLIPASATWRFMRGTNEASAPIDAWRKATFVDSQWESGSTPFHYGEDLAGGTALSDMRNRYGCVFLRRTFLVADRAAVQSLRLRAICDDGFIAWINGVEVARANVPDGERAFNTYASAAVSEPVAYVDYALPRPNYLATGTNVVAVQVFNNSLTSSDLQWNGELLSQEADATPPRLVSVEPAPGVVQDLSQVSLTFSEPVLGVSAADLRLGGQSATSLAQSGNRFTFRFGTVPTGPVELRWDADTLIVDEAVPANRLDLAQAGPWSYVLVDATAPSMIEVGPRAGVTVRSLTQVTVTFSESVQGVDAADLRVNEVPAIAVSGSAAGPYRFTFPAPLPGEVRITWATDHHISDWAEPANAFVPSNWQVRLDPDFVPPTVRINEFLAANIAATGAKDEDNELQDWVELLNQGNTTVNLEGWSLTDDRDDPDRWVFPSVTLGPGQYLLVYASGKDRRETGAGRLLHTNFKLNPAGEYLALLSPDSPRAVVSEFSPAFPVQRSDYSCGYDLDGRLRYFRSPTPGAPNAASAIEGVVPLPQVDPPRGWHEAPFEVAFNSSLPEVTYRYTTDGTDPTETNGRTYTGPLRIASTTTLRVVSFHPNRLPSATATVTYLFAADVLRQSNAPAGFPVGTTAWGGYPADYEMDPEIVTHQAYVGLMKGALLALPTVSLVCRSSDLFDASTGIYTHPTARGPAWERPCSLELIPNDGSQGFQADAGVQIQGNAAREPQKQPKHPLRIVFKGDYGPTHLEYPVFPDTPVTRYDTLILRADFNFSWLHWNSHQRIRAQRTRDAWMKDSLRAMGGLATHNRYVNLFINGLYWGVYDPSERPDGAFAAAYLGGEKEDYDVMNEGAAVDGDNRAYTEMLAIADLSSPIAYARMQQFLDIPQYIDYILLHFYVGHQDWGKDKNWYAIRPKDGSSGFRYLAWDGEMILDEPTDNRVNNSDTPSGLHTKLVSNAEYRLAFADRVRRHLFHEGALTPAAVDERWMGRAREVELAVVAESARWGDYRRDVHPYQIGPYDLYTRDNQWVAEQQRLRSQYFPVRTATVLAQLRAAGLYPTVEAPDFSRRGGSVESGFALSLTAPAGTIYCTIDGQDPRVAGSGAVAATAIAYTRPLVLTQEVRVRARAFRQGVWSALTEADFQVASVGSTLRITEIMYHPVGGDAFEFVELQNAGRVETEVTGFYFDGIDYLFPHRTLLRPAQRIVLASGISPASFASRYPRASVFGYFRGALGNGGERLVLRDRRGNPVASVTYRDDGAWPVGADGDGFSLELIAVDADPNDPANWRQSQGLNGSPGEGGGPTPTLPPLHLNEIYAGSRSTVASPDDGSDWLELQNAGDLPVTLDGWTLTDHGSTPLRFPAGTVVAPNGFLVVPCGGPSNLAGLRASFRLAREGETVSLLNALGQRVDAVTFGRQVSACSLGRVGASNTWQLTQPTPGGANVVAETAGAAALRLNEWLANPVPGQDDWIELYNSDATRPVSLRGLAMVVDERLAKIFELSFIEPRGFYRLWLNDVVRAGHLSLRLPAAGATVRLLDRTGAAIDRVGYGPQTEAISEGRLTDGGVEIGKFVRGPTPGYSNVEPPQLQDSDADGLPDDWERAEGTDPLVADATDDPDHDGLPNAAEYAAGTHPRNAASVLRILRVVVQTGKVTLEFQASANRSYALLSAAALADKSWSRVAEIKAQAVERVESVEDTPPITGVRFYRLVTPAP